MAYIIVDEIYRALREDASIQGAAAPGAVNVQTTGGNAGGPVISTGFNLTPFKIMGIMS